MYTSKLSPVSNLVPSAAGKRSAANVIPCTTLVTAENDLPDSIVTSKMYNSKYGTGLVAAASEKNSNPLALAVACTTPLSLVKLSVVNPLMSGVPSVSVGSNLI